MTTATMDPITRRERLFMVKKKRETFGQKVVRLREAAELSQYALAKKAGMSQQALSYLESSDGDPNWATVQKIAAALDVSCEEFTDPEIQATDYTPGKPGPKPRPGRPSGQKKRKKGGGE